LWSDFRRETRSHDVGRLATQLPSRGIAGVGGSVVEFRCCAGRGRGPASDRTYSTSASSGFIPLVRDLEAELAHSDLTAPPPPRLNPPLLVPLSPASPPAPSSRGRPSRPYRTQAGGGHEKSFRVFRISHSIFHYGTGADLTPTEAVGLSGPRHLKGDNCLDRNPRYMEVKESLWRRLSRRLQRDMEPTGRAGQVS